MFRKAFWFMLGLGVVTAPAVAVAAQADEVDVDSLSELVRALLDAAKGGEWSVVVSLGIMVLVFLATKIRVIQPLIPPKARPWVAVSAGVLSAIAAVALDSGDWFSAIIQGLVTGAAASGFWDLVGKSMLKPEEQA